MIRAHRYAAGLALAVAAGAVLATPAAAGPTIQHITFSDCVDNTCGIFIAELDGSNPRLFELNSYYSPAWSPDSTRYLIGHDYAPLYNKRYDGSDVIEVGTAGRWYGTTPAWMPDGESVLYTSFAYATLYVVGTHGGDTGAPFYPLEHRCGQDMAATVGPDGTVIIERTECPADAPSLWRLAPGATEPAPLLGHAGGPALSPDGTRLAYLVDGRLWVADADGGNPVQLTADDRWVHYAPAWSPDGTSLLFADTDDGDGYDKKLKRIDLATGEQTTVRTGVRGPVSWVARPVTPW